MIRARNCSSMHRYPCIMKELRSVHDTVKTNRGNALRSNAKGHVELDTERFGYQQIID